MIDLISARSLRYSCLFFIAVDSSEIIKKNFEIQSKRLKKYSPNYCELFLVFLLPDIFKLFNFDIPGKF